ncbi:MAG: hypothetical protein J0I06_16670 [Planctomycetes bacterium]|nr:hypothetical protein [Planctomycetota bacterium]
MAKKSKETSTPLVFSLVFFILTTIAFGVMWYLAYSDQQTYIDAKAKAEKDLANVRNSAREAELLARVYRLYMGVEIDPEDKTTIANESKPGDKIAAELTKLNAAMAKKLGVADAGALPDDFKFWTTDANNKANAPPAEGLADQIGKLGKKDIAYKAAEDERESYKKQIEGMKVAAKSLADVQKKFQAEIDKMPTQFKDELKKVTDGFDNRTKLYQAAEKAANDKIAQVTEERDRLERQVGKLKERITQLEDNNQILQVEVSKVKGGKESFAFEEPQGKILRKLPEGVVEINLGSTAGVRPGLTFTVLPTDFPEKGRQSRMRMLRVPDGRGGYKSVESFVPKGSIEVYEVVGPTLSLARIQPGTELDPIRDGIAVGDLLYNSVWRKGVADHIALIGIFDINGDGADDIESVVRDLTKMGIPVDAYYDMKNRKWVGQVTERTRYIVEGYKPITSGNDPLIEEKTKLLGAIDKAVTEGRQKGVTTVDFRDFFGRMGYKFRLDVSDDKINQATGPYISNVGVGAMPPSP